MAGLLVVGLATVSPAAMASDFNYKNPAQPSKNPADLAASQYRGFHYEKAWEPYRRCVMARESGGNYKSNGTTGSGAYQFIQSTWDTAMARAGKLEWVGVRPHQAPPYVQDEAFWLMANPKPKKRGLHGRHHWSPQWALTVGKQIQDC